MIGITLGIDIIEVPFQGVRLDIAAALSAFTAALPATVQRFEQGGQQLLFGSAQLTEFDGVKRGLAAHVAGRW